MPTTEDTELFAERWNEHINELNKIGFSLPPEKIPELRDALEDLEDLVEVAAENMDDDD